MPNFSGIWSATQQMQAKGVCTWTASPGVPTMGTATAGGSLCASVTFTPPIYTGNPAGILGYRAVSTPGCITATGASSPLVVPGLSNTVSYTFKVAALGASGYSLCSNASNSITAKAVSQQAYTAAGTYTWVAPTSVTSVSVVVVGPGGGRINRGAEGTAGGGGGALAYRNNITVVPGTSYTVTIGALAVDGASGNSTFINSGTVSAQGGQGGGSGFTGGVGGAVITGTGGSGGNGAAVGGAGVVRSGAGGAGGYAGNGGAGSGLGSDGIAGAGGGGGGGTAANDGTYRGGAGGGVGILGQGANGAGGTSTVGLQNGSAGSGGSGITYGGGANPCGGVTGGSGAVRIIWPGTTRSFPSTCTGNL